jgi:hypothetical protein
VSQPPLEDLALLVQPLDVLLAIQKAMPSAVMRGGLLLRVTPTLMAALMASAVVVAVMMAMTRAMIVMTAAARHLALLSLLASSAFPPEHHVGPRVKYPVEEYRPFLPEQHLPAPRLF